MAMMKVEVICLGLQLAKSLRLRLKLLIRLKLSLNIWPLAGVLAAHVAPEPPHAVPVVHVGPEKVPRRIQALQSYGNLKLTQTALTNPPIPPEQPAEQVQDEDEEDIEDKEDIEDEEDHNEENNNEPCDLLTVCLMEDSVSVGSRVL
uniref:Uncharacterized protein n=1 Tax=Knipowitschia caucasica TaxID=637954 RepID=A0AAV2K166_KNICA